MNKLLLTLAAIILCIAFISCDPCLGVGYMCADLFSFRIVDKITKQDLVFTSSPVYQRDSVYLSTTLPGYSGSLSSSDSNKFTSRLSIPVDTFFLRISSTDSDTLLMNYDFVEMKCCKNGRGYGKLLGIKYNGVNAPKEGDIYLFQK